LDTYTLAEIIELNDLSEEEILEYLVGEKVIRLPDVLPLDAS